MVRARQLGQQSFCLNGLCIFDMICSHLKLLLSFTLFETNSFIRETARPACMARRWAVAPRPMRPMLLRPLPSTSQTNGSHEPHVDGDKLRLKHET